MARIFTVSFLMSLLVSGAALLGACFDRPAPACAFWCGIQSACPDGYRCAADQWCKRDDVPETHECGPGPTEDAAPADAIPADASPDPGDAGDAPDARDAGIIDAALIDANLPDAAPVPAIDAALADANSAGLR